MAYTLFIVFYAPLITLSASLAPQFQPKVISILIITLALSLLGRIFLYADRAETIERRGLKLILLAALITVFFQINKVLPYSSIAVFLAVATISYGTINIKIFSTTYDYKKRHIAIALMIFILLPFLNLIQLDNSKRTIGFIKYHSVWAKENFPYTTADWTLKSNYSYSEFSKILSNKYKILNINSEKDLNEVTPQCDAVIIMTPTVPFNVSEKKSIKKFLNQNGKVIVIGDHTDLYGHGRVINDLIQHAGISINYDTHFEPDNWHGLISFRNTLMGKVRPLSASSISVKKPVYVMAWSHNWVSEAANYNSPNFFGDLTWTADDKFGDFPMAITAKVGGGHLTLWTDSTMFSNFALYQPRMIQTIDHLINNGAFLSSVTYYYSFLIIIFFALLFFSNKHRGYLLLIIFFISSVASGLYLIYFTETDGYYDVKSQIHIFCKENIIREVPSNRDPELYSLSNLYSNIARYDLQPMWISENPSRCSTNQTCIWLTTYENYNKWNGYKPTHIVVIDDHEDISKLGYKRIFVNTEVTSLGLSESSNRELWVTSDSKHSIVFPETTIFTSDGVLDDYTIGNWWAAIEVSLYRKEMIKRFIDWIRKKEEINLFHYPKSGIVPGKKRAILIQSGKEDKELRNVDFDVLEYEKKKYVYLGGEMWGIFHKEGQKYFIVGGPETSDNYLKHRDFRFLISIH